MSLPRRRTRVWIGVSLRVCCDSSSATAVLWPPLAFWMGPGFSTLLRECVIGVPNGNGENGDVARDAGLAAVEDICLCGVTSSMASNGEKGADEFAGGRRRDDIAQLLRNVGGVFRTCNTWALTRATSGCDTLRVNRSRPPLCRRSRGPSASTHLAGTRCSP